MIHEILIENFLSIKKEIKLNLEASSSKQLPNNLISSNDSNFLKSVVIYGANASGKSNIIRAVLFLWNMVANSHKFNVDSKIPRVPFKLDSKSEQKPSKFEIKFAYEKIKYRYGFSCDNEKIIDEYLYYSPKGRLALVFKREKTNKFTFTSDNARQENIKNQTLSNTLYLSRATQLGYDKTKKTYEFIVNNIVINMHPNWQDYTFKQIYENPKLKERIVEILRKADFGGIEDIKIKKERRKGKEIKIEKDSFSQRDIENDFYEPIFSHKKKIGDKETYVDFNIDEESHGTQKFLAMLGPILEILEQDKIIFIDELELNLHSEITKLIIKLFHNLSNKKAQLVFTTHDTNLLDNELFRKDQIYIVTREPNDQTLLNSFLEFNLRQENDFERAYLTGRVGGLPFIDETLVD